jgi:hypothetical protein
MPARTGADLDISTPMTRTRYVQPRHVIREYYLTDRHDTPDESLWPPEIGWPIFSTGGVRGITRGKTG